METPIDERVAQLLIDVAKDNRIPGDVRVRSLMLIGEYRFGTPPRTAPRDQEIVMLRVLNCLATAEDTRARVPTYSQLRRETSTSIDEFYAVTARALELGYVVKNMVGIRHMGWLITPAGRDHLGRSVVETLDDYCGPGEAAKMLGISSARLRELDLLLKPLWFGVAGSQRRVFSRARVQRVKQYRDDNGCWPEWELPSSQS